MTFIGYGIATAQIKPRQPEPTPELTPLPVEQQITEEQFIARLQISEEESNRIEKYEQRSQLWLDARKGRLTASNFGAAVGHNKYQSPTALVRQLLWKKFKGNWCTQWGVDHEPVALAAYLQYQQRVVDTLATQLSAEELAEEALYPSRIPVAVAVEETGLVVRGPRYWMGNSPDGLVHVTYDDGVTETGLLEIKCPASKKLYPGNGIPIHYMDQIQGTMGNLGLPWCDFVVWTPTHCQVQRVAFCKRYWDEVLLPRLTNFYFRQYVPAAVKKENGCLLPNTVA